MTDDPFQQHDHLDCSRRVMAEAEDRAVSEGFRLTSIRRRVLEILLEDHRAYGAYEVLDRLVAEGHKRQPPLVYRALDFLVEHGLAHRVNRLNAFAACHSPQCEGAPVLLVCEACQAVAEAPVPEMRADIERAIGDTKFQMSRLSTEVFGICPNCTDTAI